MSNYSSDQQFPRSTMWIGAAFWAVLAGLMTWTLLATIDTGKQLARLGAERDGDNRVIVEVRQDVAQLKTDSIDIRYRVRTLEEQRRSK